MKRFVGTCLLAGLLFTMPLHAAPVRVGVLEFGTVNWEIDVIEHHALAEAQGVDLTVRRFASKEAASIAMQAGAVDVIVNDWLWVSRQRRNGEDFVFVPHSLAVGGLVVPADSSIRDLADVAGKRIGIAGGPDDKSWLLLRAWSLQALDADVAGWVDAAFGAPPLLNELVIAGELAGVLNYWHYNARLQAAGMRKVVDVAEILPALGVQKTPPLLGWTFRSSWAEDNGEAIKGFLRASLAAKKRLRDDDAEWQRLRPLMEADSNAAFMKLRDAYRQGIPESFDEADIAAARSAYAIIAGLADERLTGGYEALAPGTFWKGFRYRGEHATSRE